MANRSLRRPLNYEKDQIGCIWGLISIFDFRHGRSTNKLLSDRRRGSGQAVGAGYSRSQLLLTNSDENCESTYDDKGSEREKAGVGKTSVKELMDEEMVIEQDLKKQTNSDNVEPKESDSQRRGRAKKNRKRTKKASKKSFDAQAEPENPGDQVSEQTIMNNLDLDVIMEELCHHIHQKSSNCLKHDNLDVQLNHESHVFEEKMSEALNVFVNQKFNEKHLVEGEKIQHSKEFMDSLQTLSSNKDLFLKLLRDPDSILVKSIKNVGNDQLERDQKSESVERSALLDEEPSISKPSELVNRKNPNFFRRKRKSQERKSLDGNENSRPTSRIVVLKPGPPTTVENSESEKNLSSSLQFHYSGNNGQSDRISSQFSFSEIKRKLKNAMGKERPEISCEHPNTGNGVENSGWSSPNRNHFYTEKFTRKRIGKPKDIETNMGNETVGPSEKMVPNIYIEAKKHLSELLSNGDEIEELSSRQVPKTLGRILSLPEFNFSPIGSPGRDKEHNFVTAQMRFSLKNHFHVVQETDVSNVGSPRQSIESQSCIANENLNEEVKAPNSNLFPSDESYNANAMEETLSSIRDETRSEGVVEIVNTTDTFVQEESKVLDVSAEKCSSSITIDGENSDAAETCNEENSSQCLKSDSLVEDQSLSSPLESPSTITMKAEDRENAHEKPAQPSPVSVLEPLFTEDDMSPASIKSQPGEKTTQPLPIRLEEQTSISIDYGMCIRTSMEDEESTFEYVEAVLLGSGLNWDEFLFRWLSSDELLEPSLFDEVDLFANRSCQEQKLLFDCTNEVLKEVCECYFGHSPWVSFVKKNVRPVPRGKNLICEVWEGVRWHFLVQPPPRTLDQIVRKDMEKVGTWMDLRSDTESVSIEIGEEILEELMEDTLLGFVNEGPESDFALLRAELMDDGSSISL